MANAETVSRNQAETEELIVELCLKCDDDEVKEALKKYKYGRSIVDIAKKMKSGVASKIEPLKRLLLFLNNNDESISSPTKKDDIVHAIVCRIQNLLPEDCDTCNASGWNWKKKQSCDVQAVDKAATKSAY